MTAWSIDPSKFGETVTKDHRQLCVGVAFAIDSGVVGDTPRKTGRAAGNWLPSVGTPRTETIDIRDAAAAVAEAASTFNGAPEFPVLYIANNLPYIVPLNSGSSVQAPAGFVEANIDRVVANANRGGK